MNSCEARKRRIEQVGGDIADLGDCFQRVSLRFRLQIVETADLSAQSHTRGGGAKCFIYMLARTTGEKIFPDLNTYLEQITLFT